jgi:hypothetical protein
MNSEDTNSAAGSRCLGIPGDCGEFPVVNLSQECAEPFYLPLLECACVGDSSRFEFCAPGFFTDWKWSVLGQLPPGMIFSPNYPVANRAVISGAPSTPGAYFFTLMVTDQVSIYIFKSVQINILQIDTVTIPSSIVGVPFYYEMQASGGSGEYIWQIESGHLEDGLSMDIFGVITGTPTSDNRSDISVVMDDASCLGYTQYLPIDFGGWPGGAGWSFTSSVCGKMISVVINAGATIDQINQAANLFANQVLAAFAACLTTGSSVPYGGCSILAATSGVNSYGSINNNLKIATNYADLGSICVCNDNSFSKYLQATGGGMVVIDTARFLDYCGSLVGQPTARQYLWKVSSGTLPPGLSLDCKTGEIYGSIDCDVEMGHHQFSVGVLSGKLANQTITTTYWDMLQCGGYTIAFVPRVTKTMTHPTVYFEKTKLLVIDIVGINDPGVVPLSEAGVPYSFQFTDSIGGSLKTWTVDTEVIPMPSGITLTTAGELTGTSAEEGAFNLIISVFAPGDPLLGIDDITCKRTVASKVNTPYYTPVHGAYVGNQTITIHCDTPGVAIYYTTDGSDPTVGGTLYTAPFVITEDKTIKAYATRPDMPDSNVQSGDYTICTVPTQTSISGDQLVEDGGGCLLTIDAAGTPDLNYQWWHTDIHGTTTMLVGETSPTLALVGFAIGAAVEGTYWCIVTNGCGTLHSSFVSCMTCLSNQTIFDSIVWNNVGTGGTPPPFGSASGLSGSLEIPDITSGLHNVGRMMVQSCNVCNPTGSGVTMATFTWSGFSPTFYGPYLPGQEPYIAFGAGSSMVSSADPSGTLVRPMPVGNRGFRVETSVTNGYCGPISWSITLS